MPNDSEEEVQNCAASMYNFILYIAGNLPNSTQAVLNLKELCTAHFSENCQVEIVDLLRDPQRGLADGILVTPTLVKLEPSPKQTIMGNLTDVPMVLRSISWIGPANGESGDPEK